MSLPATERSRLARLLTAIAHVDQKSGSIRGRCQAVACPGLSSATIYRAWKLWHGGGSKGGEIYSPHNWRSLVRDYRPATCTLPREFIAYLVSLWAETTRDKDAFRGVYRRLVQQWLSGQEIPGYGRSWEWYRSQNLPQPDAQIQRKQDLPRGWSESNLHRALKRALPRQSQRRAAQGQVNRLNTRWGSQMLRDRSTLQPLQLWTIDDVRLDLQARMFVDGKWQIVYVDALFALDVATGYVLAYGIKGMATRGESTESGRAAGTKMSIDSRDVRHLLLHVLQKFGLPPYESTLVCEMATAKLSKDDETAFAHFLGEQLRVDYTGMGRGQLLQSGFAEEWGRPGLKGWIESYFRLLHTSLNNLPGTTGRRYELTRGDHADRVRYTMQLVRKAEKLIDGPLTPDHPLMDQLQFPILTVDEVNGVVAEMVEALNWRTDHRLQGFDRVFEYRGADGLWHPEGDLSLLPPEQRTGLELVPRMEAPAERLKRLVTEVRSQFRALDPSILSALYMDKRRVTARGGRVTISDARLGPDRIIFACQDNALDHYEDTQELLAYIAPDQSHAVVADSRTGAHVSTLWRENRVDITDKEAVGKRAGEVHRAQEAELANIRDYLSDDAGQRMRERNEQSLYCPRSSLGRSMATEISAARAATRQKQRNARTIDQATRRAAKQIEGGSMDFAQIASEETPSERDYAFNDITNILSED